MKCLVLQYYATANDQLYVGAVFLDNAGLPVDEQNLPIGNFPITAFSDMLVPVQNAIIAYSTTMGYGITGADILNPPSAAVGID